MKTLKWLAMPLLALALTSTFSACSDSKGDEEDGGEGGGLPAGALTPEENKERLSQIGKDFINAIPASDFNELDQLATHIKNNYCSTDYQVEDVEDWADRCFKSLTKTVLPDKVTNYATYEYTRRIYELSKFRGHLTYNGSKWVVEEANDLQATCTDQNGQQVVARLTTSGAVKKVYIGEIEMDEDYTYEGGSYKDIYEMDEAYAVIPENITITLTRGNQALVNVTVTTDLRSVSGENFDLSKDGAVVTVRAQLAGYDINCQRIAAKANTAGGLYAKFTVSKGGRSLLVAETQGNVNYSGSNLVWSEDTNVDEFEENVQNFGGKVTGVSCDIMGRLQVRGYCTDARALADAFENAEDNKRNAEAVRNYAKTANDCFAAAFYYDGTDVPQGAMEFEAVANSTGEKYYIEPVIVFADASRYNMTNDSYFSEENFKSLVDLFDSLANGYEDMVNKYDE